MRATRHTSRATRHTIFYARGSRPSRWSNRLKIQVVFMFSVHLSTIFSPPPLINQQTPPVTPTPHQQLNHLHPSSANLRDHRVLASGTSCCLFVCQETFSFLKTPHLLRPKQNPATKPRIPAMGASQSKFTCAAWRRLWVECDFVWSTVDVWSTVEGNFTE